MDELRCNSCGSDVDEQGRSTPPKQPDGFLNPSLCADAVCLRHDKEGELEIILIQRGREPFQGKLGLPGGFIDYGEKPEDAVLRELEEETSVVGSKPKLLFAKGAPERDPRKHVVSLIFRVDVEQSSEPKGGDDAADAAWLNLNSVLKQNDSDFAFDHASIIRDVARSIGLL